jgi:hypothetical protein
MADRAAIKIRRQILDVEVEGTESVGLALQHSLPTLCTEVLSPTLESALARFDPGDAYLYVEHIAIDLTSNLERLGADLTEAVERGVVDYFLRNPPTRSESTAAGRPDEVRRRTDAETIDEALVAFLRTGRLPWSFRVPLGTRLEQMVLNTWALVDTEPAPPPRTRVLLMEVLALSTARARLVIQFTPDFATAVLRSLSPRVAAGLTEVLRTVGTSDSPSPVKVKFTRKLWDAALAAAADGSEHWSGRAELIETAWRSMKPDERHDPDFVNLVEGHWPGLTKQAASLLADKDLETSQPVLSSSRIDATEESEGILVANAGIVLLHPFLTRLFEALGIVVNDQLLDPNRALCLLHFLSTGEHTAPEHQLTVAKVLCSVPLEEPVEAEVGLTTSDMDEANALIQAAISHWEALLNTSPDALRGEFLTRPGQLSLDDEGDWLLRVETRTVDIMLDQLPWGISMVKLPWMNRLIRVEWR